MISIVVGLIALAVALMLSSAIGKAPAGTARMQEIAGYIHEGAMAFLFREYKALAAFVVVVAIVISMFLSPLTAVCFVAGAVFSVCAGYIGMTVATKANVRTAAAAQNGGMPEALKIAFSGGAVMGLGVVGLGIVGVAAAYMLFGNIDIVTGFGLGASSIALFARVGGGIYTKAADVGADLVGKVEEGLPEDDPRNPATIADNVGDNVGDVAGMGADLFESYVGAIISAITLGAVAYPGGEGIMFVFELAFAGIIASLIGVFYARSSKSTNPQAALNHGTYVGGVIVIAAAYYLSTSIFGNTAAFVAIASGLVVGLLIGKITEIYTSADYASVKKIAEQSETGPATTIISGLAVGMYSTFLPMIFICVGVILAFFTMGGAKDPGMGLFGISLAAVGMLSTTGLTVAVDAYGPIADNAGGIAEMSELPPEVREITDTLDSVGNTTAAIGKGFAIGSAALTALALFSAYAHTVGLKAIDLLNPVTLIGLFIGATLPFVFGAMTMESVGKAAYQMIEEVRRQFHEIPGLLEGKAKADYQKCVDISTAAALHEMIMPGIIAIVAPLLVGFLFGTEALGGLIGGSLASGVLVAILMANAGGAWDNAKKFVEASGRKHTPVHDATVVGDTVGDPFKDTSGPAMNILIKLMTIVSLVFAPVLAANGGILLGLFK
ncbi:sodium-translocating pyrophosphatase [uncultured Phascolarctobacterium sp.]|uniref:sodium-translocating pyrophosphatase n=1 Tax=uncultured Phascolarctobacterium sp. TaxID=512296 RepID=UPI00345D7188